MYTRTTLKREEVLSLPSFAKHVFERRSHPASDVTTVIIREARRLHDYSGLRITVKFLYTTTIVHMRDQSGVFRR